DRQSKALHLQDSGQLASPCPLAMLSEVCSAALSGNVYPLPVMDVCSQRILPMFNAYRKSVEAKLQASSKTLEQSQAKLAAISNSMAMIEFSPDGFILDANANFCQTMGYEVDDLLGKHHRIFCPPAFASSPEYTQLWQGLAQGKAIS